MKKLYVLVISFFITGQLLAQNPITRWAKAIGGTGDDIVRTMSTDQQGNVYIGGTFSGSMDFDPGPNDETRFTHSPSSSEWDGFVAKYDADGDFQWVAVLGGSDYDAVLGVTADLTGVYVTGYFKGDAEFNESGTQTMSSYAGSEDIFIAKYAASNGALVNMNSIGSNGVDVAWAIDMDDNSNLYLAGQFEFTVQFDNFNVASPTTAWGSTDMFLVKLNSSFTYQWGIGIGSDGSDAAQAVEVDGNSVWVGGRYSSFLYSNPDNTTTGIGCVGGYDGFFGQYSTADGSYMWDGYVRSLGDDYVTTMSVDANGIYTGGYFSQSAQIWGNAGNNVTITSKGYFDGFVARHDKNTKLIQWANSFGSATDNEYVDDVTTLGAAVYVVGTFAASMDVDPTDTQYILQNTAVTLDAYMVKFNFEQGYLVAAQTISDITGQEEAMCVTTANGSVYWGGYFNGSEIDLDPSAGSEIPRFTQGAYDMFFGRLDAANPPDAPGDINFWDVQETYVQFTVTPPPVAPDGYLVLYKIASDPTGVPEDGVEYYPGDVIGNGKVLYWSDYTTSGFNANPGINYHVAIYSYNGRGEGINYSTTALQAQITTLGTNLDTDAPDVVDNSPTKVAPGATVKISVTVTDDTGVDNVYLTYYPINSLRQGFAAMQQKDGAEDVYEYEIPADFNTEQGVEYLVRADDVVGNSTDRAFSQVVVEYTGNGLTIPYTAGTAQTNYRIISVPLNLTQKSVTSVFDELGDYNKSKYRLFHYGNNSTTELSGSSNIELGQGYWFLAAESKTINTGPGTTALVGDGKPLRIPITVGWNQIGNPYNFDVPVALIKNHPDNSDVTFGDFKSYEGSFSTATTLKKMSGGFVMVQAAGDGQLRIPVYDAGSRVAAPVNFQQSLNSNTWAVDLVLKSSGMKNTFGGFGMHPDASEENDKYDDFTLPRFLEYLELNYNKKFFGSAFTKDIVPTSVQHMWEFEVDTNLPDEIMELNWDNSYFGSTDLQLVLWDVDQQRAVDMKAENNYVFERSQSHAFKVFFGNDIYVKSETLPFRAVFHSASPVPSSGNVTFGFSVPEAGNGQKTNLAIYNLMGQKVANLVDQALPAGYQQAIWNIESGVKPATGVYISVLKFGDTTLQKRLIIK